MTTKAVGITNLTDARYFAAQGVTWMHFDFRETSPQFIPLIQANAIMDWVGGVKFIGQWDTNDVEELNRFLHNTKLKAVQIEEDFPIDAIAYIDTETIFRKFFIDERTTLHNLQQLIEKSAFESKIVSEIVAPHHTFENIFLFNKKIIFEDFINLTGQFPVSLDINFSIKDLPQIAPLNLNTLCLHGGDEEQIGIKSYDELDEIFEAVISYGL